MQIGSACNRGDLIPSSDIGLASGLIGFPGGASGKESACQCRRYRFNPRGWEDSLEKEMETHFSILTWEIPCTEGYSP